ncbi:hypothetical protein FQA39_LY17465 [Lamprigera yunnana]|nr:hypothetical protein FQA39_LY17465 [Lamprigera yunnana]
MGELKIVDPHFFGIREYDLPNNITIFVADYNEIFSYDSVESLIRMWTDAIIFKKDVFNAVYVEKIRSKFLYYNVQLLRLKQKEEENCTGTETKGLFLKTLNTAKIVAKAATIMFNSTIFGRRVQKVLEKLKYVYTFEFLNILYYFIDSIHY